MKRSIRLFAFVGFVLFVQGVFGQESKSPWDGSKELFPGIHHVFLERTEPRLMKINVVRIDLQTGLYGVCTSTKDELWNQPMPDHDPACKRCKTPPLVVTKRQTTRNFLKENRVAGKKMVLGVNASPWGPWGCGASKYAGRMGLFISQGEVLDDNDRGRPSFIVLKDGSVDFRYPGSEIPNDKIFISVPGFAVILDKGEVTAGAAGDKSCHPRTGYGLSKNRRYIYFITVDGRQKDYSMGATTGELAALLKEFGAYDGLNMDGGGSTTLAIWQEDKGNAKDNVKILNHQAGGAERANGNNLGFYLVK